MNETALVTGATGAIGPSLVNHLLRHGYRVRVLARAAPPTGLFPDAVAVVRGTIDDAVAVRAAMDRVDRVFHLAATLHIPDPGPEMRDDYTRVNVEGTRCLVDAAQEAGVQRFIFFSTINVYGPSRAGQVLDESSPLQPDSWYAETKAQAEQIVLAGPPAVVLRLAAVYGPRMKGNYPRLLHALKRGRFVPIGDGRNRRTLVYANDACSAAVSAAERPQAAGQIFNVTDGRIHTLREIIAAMGQALGRRPPLFHLPTGPILLGAGLLEDGARMLGKRSPVARSTVRKLLEDVAVSGAKVQQVLGFHPQYDLARGWQETVQGEPSRIASKG